ncbi:MAG: hypothetical protein QG646_1932 [Euryarchaeota archaeon]|nr:hypothetical protein [Euryarchaeota archaeon]
MYILKKPGIYLLLAFFLLPGIAGASGQDSINDLIKNGGNVNLSGTYTLTGPIMLSSDLKLNGQNLTTITIPDNANWSVWVPLIKGVGLHDVTLEGIEFNVNSDGNDETPHGRGYYNCIHLINCTNVTVKNCIFHDGKGDGLRTKYCKNVQFYNNIAYKLGHDCFYAIDSENIWAWNNTLTTRTNSGLRIWNSKNVQFFCNRINAQLDSLGGNPGIQIEDSKGTMDDVRVFANDIYKTWGPGIWLISYDTGSENSQNITVDHNLILKDGVSYNIEYTAGITIDGVKGTNISNNVFDGCNNAGVLVLDGESNTVIKNNIITNTNEHAAISQTGTGYGVNNRQEAPISILNNCFFNNVNGNVFGADSTGNDLQDPTNHNTSSDWVWKDNAWSCDYLREMENYVNENSTFFNEIFDNETINEGADNANDNDLHEITYVYKNNTCQLKNITGNLTDSNSEYETMCSEFNNTQLVLKVIDNSQSETDSENNSSDGTSSVKSQTQNVSSYQLASNNSSGGTTTELNQTVTSVSTPILPVSVFITNPINCSGNVPLIVDFHSTALNASTIKWDFGDTVNNSATGTDVSHTYSANGTYTVIQTVINSNGTLTSEAQINVNSITAPSVADFIATPINGKAPFRVNFTDKSQYTAAPGSVVIYNFGEGEGTSSERNTSHIYMIPGTYYATQAVTNSENPAGVNTKTVIITVGESNVSLVSNFNGNSTS